MKVSGVICEYNPFHNGHALHLCKAREAAGADYIICAMSGSWTQRGEPAIVDKWTRARMALLHGADLVLELPTAMAVRSARDFARGGVALLGALSVCTHLSFGSEEPLAALRAAAAREEGSGVKSALARGESYPRAVSDAGTLTKPNATLGVEYLRALAALAPDMEPVAIARDVPHASQAMAAITSASAIRAAAARGEAFDIAMPSDCAHLFRQALARQGGPADWERLAPVALGALRDAQPEQIARFYGVSEGLENRMIRAAMRASGVVALFDAIKCKRYTHARIRRAVAHVTLNIPALSLRPSYARVLGFRREAQALLRAIKRRADIPLITKLPKEPKDPLLAIDIRANDLWALACPSAQPAKLDYAHPIQIL